MAETHAIDVLRQALEEIRDHGKVETYPCHALADADCIDVMRERARAALAHVAHPPAGEGRTPREWTLVRRNRGSDQPFAGYDVLAGDELAIDEEVQARELLPSAPEAEGAREVNWKARLVEQGERLRGLLRDQRASIRTARRFIALEDYAAAEDVLAAVDGDDVDPPPAAETEGAREWLTGPAAREVLAAHFGGIPGALRRGRADMIRDEDLARAERALTVLAAALPPAPEAREGDERELVTLVRPASSERWAQTDGDGAVVAKQGWEVGTFVRVDRSAAPVEPEAGDGAAPSDEGLRSARALIDYVGGLGLPWSGVPVEHVAHVHDMLDAAGAEVAPHGCSRALAFAATRCPDCGGAGGFQDETYPGGASWKCSSCGETGYVPRTGPSPSVGDGEREEDACA